jgi:hypothetical protein
MLFVYLSHFLVTDDPVVVFKLVLYVFVMYLLLIEGVIVEVCKGVI